MLELSSNQLKKDAHVRWEIDHEHFTECNIRYYDKDGFELCPLEKNYYRIHGYPFRHHLNHESVWQEDWFVQTNTTQGLIVDHSMILHRCDFLDSAREQIKLHVNKLPRLNFLLSTRCKWGVDIALDWANEKTAFEIFHLEMDSYSYDEACADKERIEKFVLSTDWTDAAKQIQQHRNQWESLTGFEQNNWKARFFGFEKAERTQKSGG